MIALVSVVLKRTWLFVETVTGHVIATTCVEVITRAKQCRPFVDFTCPDNNTQPYLWSVILFILIIHLGIDPSVAFAALRKYQPNGPLVNSEFYPGWLDHWGSRHHKKSAASIAEYLDKILAINASVNLYMFEGGTNFGFMNGKYCVESLNNSNLH